MNKGCSAYAPLLTKVARLWARLVPSVLVKANLIDGSILSFHRSKTGSYRSDRNRSTAIRVLLCHPSSKLDATDITRAKTEGQTDEMMNAIVDTQTSRILGCSLLCHEAGEVILTVQMMMQAQMPYTVLRDGVLAHPTMTLRIKYPVFPIVKQQLQYHWTNNHEKTRRKSRSCHWRH